MNSILFTFWNLNAIDEKSLELPDLEDFLRIRTAGLQFSIVLSRFNLDEYSLYWNSKLHSILLQA